MCSHTTYKNRQKCPTKRKKRERERESESESERKGERDPWAPQVSMHT